jgi:hypothetical protein
MKPKPMSPIREFLEKSFKWNNWKVNSPSKLFFLAVAFYPWVILGSTYERVLFSIACLVVVFMEV